MAHLTNNEEMNMYCPISAQIDAHLREEARLEAKHDRIRELAHELLEDPEGRELLEDEYPEVMKAHRMLAGMILNARLMSSLSLAEVELKAAYLIAAKKQAEKLYAIEVRQAREEALMNAYEHHWRAA